MFPQGRDEILPKVGTVFLQVLPVPVEIVVRDPFRRDPRRIKPDGEGQSCPKEGASYPGGNRRREMPALQTSGRQTTQPPPPQGQHQEEPEVERTQQQP